MLQCQPIVGRQIFHNILVALLATASSIMIGIGSNAYIGCGVFFGFWALFCFFEGSEK
jgi:hypothetical protein